MERYSRNLLSEDFDLQEQQLLAKAKVLVVGAGGLGSYVLQHLTAIGVGKIVVMEFDNVSLSNLNRQILYTTPDIGELKSECAKRRLNSLNPEVEIEIHNCRFTKESSESVVQECDMVVDCSDNFTARIDMDIVCQKYKKPFIHASVSSFKGQITTFDYTQESPTYRDLFSIDKNIDSTPEGTLSPIVGVVGSLQAAEVVKIATKKGKPLYGRLLMIDLSTLSIREFSL